MKINVGCGRHVLDGWVNVDVQRSAHAVREPEILGDVRNIPLPDNCADEVMAIHVFEHFHYWECHEAVQEWKRLLKPGGSLVLEMPDLLKCCLNIVNKMQEKTPGQLGMWGLYGDPRDKDPYMTHKWGWCPETLMTFLLSHGLVNVKEEDSQWHRVGKRVRDMRVTATKPSLK